MIDGVAESEGEKFAQLPTLPAAHGWHGAVIAQIHDEVGAEEAVDGEGELVLPVTLEIFIVCEGEYSRLPFDVVANLPRPFYFGAGTIGVFCAVSFFESVGDFINLSVDDGFEVIGERGDGHAQRERFFFVGEVIGHTKTDVQFSRGEERCGALVGADFIAVEHRGLEHAGEGVIPVVDGFVAEFGVYLKAVFRQGVFPVGVILGSGQGGSPLEVVFE